MPGTESATTWIGQHANSMASSHPHRAGLAVEVAPLFIAEGYSSAPTTTSRML
ncbi:MAG: hypothetical protein IPH43_10970 [Xanthomonadales bacterium]|uniref:hypothetical protein n=1 Tax=Dokdonella sp. TaxID=2291710 RepID=UPI002B9C6899|nr:hypothetical protein [Xanthomonadales bacterium]MBK7013117.1 hypothetical protein [Xanthomonadales bacterium]HQW76571.1 hypothetical protein [Dokdonella sp.]HQX64699.1 hypothetical protein [Dokdonella sp.]HQY54701.1 hypothetical protein [Dokdonella sp.]